MSISWKKRGPSRALRKQKPPPASGGSNRWVSAGVPGCYGCYGAAGERDTPRARCNGL